MGHDLVEWLHASAPKRQLYAHPPLALALCQVRFATRFGLGDAGVAPFQAAIEDDYPNPGRAQFAAIQIESAIGQVGIQTPSSSPLWQFTDETGDWTVSLTQDFVSLETRAYADFDEFQERLQHIADAAIKSVKLGVGQRIGLRYINEIRSANRDWTGIVRRDLLGPLTLEPFRANCDQALQVLSLRAGTARINLQHGVFPTGSTVVPKPGTRAGDQPFYLLDIDMYEEFSPPKSLKMQPSVISSHVKRYHTTVSELFRWATTAEYRASLGERGHVR